MTIPSSNLDAAKNDAFKTAILAVAAIDAEGRISLPTRTYYKVAADHNIKSLQAQSIATGRKQIGIVTGMVANFSKTDAKTVRLVAKGQPATVTAEEESARHAACAACEFFLTTEQRCSECRCLKGSYLPNKWKWRAATCPKNKWPPLPGATSATPPR